MWSLLFNMLSMAMFIPFTNFNKIVIDKIKNNFLGLTTCAKETCHACRYVFVN